MKIETFVTGIIGTNTYVAYNETTKEAVLVDRPLYKEVDALY